MGIVFNIQRFCTNDGPGIRTTVFLKGCPMKCVWCHNPESQSTNTEISYEKDKCVLCGNCVRMCDRHCHFIMNNEHIFSREHCISCGKCAQCNALEKIGEELKADDVIKEVLKDDVFYAVSKGGVTFSGGEPFYQYDFFLELLKLSKKNRINVCVETSGMCAENQIIEAAEYIDCFLYDFKIYDDDLHKKYTGASNKIIMKNLSVLNTIGKNIILRCPIIPGINNNNHHFSKIGDMAQKLKNVTEVNIEPYHRLGERKYAILDRKIAYSHKEPIKNTEKALWVSEIKKYTNKKVVIS